MNQPGLESNRATAAPALAAANSGSPARARQADQATGFRAPERSAPAQSPVPRPRGHDLTAGPRLAALSCDRQGALSRKGRALTLCG
jgi:hypothetical protein